MNTVFFDFDGTLTKQDMLRLFANFIADYQGNYSRLVLFYGTAVLFKLKLINEKRFKEAFMFIFIRGMNMHEAEAIASLFLSEKLNKYINNDVFRNLTNHIISGDKVYLASANFDFLLEPLIKEWNLTGVISTETGKTDNLFTGRIIGDTCKGKKKVNKIRRLLGNDVLNSAIVYADSEDRFLLDSAKYSFEIQGAL